MFRKLEANLIIEHIMNCGSSNIVTIYSNEIDKVYEDKNKIQYFAKNGVEVTVYKAHICWSRVTK